MVLALRDVLDFPALQRADPLVVAGAERLDNVVRWLHVSEQPDVASFLSGGELLLTTGMLLAHDQAAQERFVDQLAEAGVAGVAVRVGRTLPEVPAAMVRQAQRLGLPLVALRRRIGFAEAMEEVHRALVSEQAALLRRAAGLRDEFNELVLQGRSVAEVVGRLAQLLGATVVIEDAARRPLHVAGDARPARDQETWSRHSRTGHADGSSLLTLCGIETEPRCAWVSLRVREEPWGRLHVLRDGPALDELERMAVERAAAAVVLSVIADRHVPAPDDPAGGALVSDLLNGRPGGAERLRRRARGVGLDLDPTGTVMAWAVAPARTGTGSGTTDEPPRIAEDRRAVESALRSALPPGGSLLGWHGERLVALNAGSRVGGAAAGDLLPDPLRDRFVVGISELLPGDCVREAVLQALEAAKVAAGSAERPRVRQFQRLGLDGLLSPSLAGPALARFVEGELGPLLARDAALEPADGVAGEPLLPVFEALLRANGRAARAAAELGVDRRTLAARVPVLENLLDADLDSFDTRLRFSVALHGLRMLEADGHPDPAA